MKKKKRLLCAILASLCLTGSAMAAYAIGFNVTYPWDTYSNKAKKGNHNQPFSVSGSNGVLYCQSQGVTNPSVNSYTTSISRGNPGSSASYQSYASNGDEFRMSTSSNVYEFQATGWYTP